tara:strand:+ start:13251 stop:13502 length:252 start_codon:yes stop_codon:yes gene_type:complete
MRDKQRVLEAAFSASRKYGQYGRGITLFRTTDGPAFVKTVITGSRKQREVEARETLKTIAMLGGEPVFSLLPNGGDYLGKRGY